MNGFAAFLAWPIEARLGLAGVCGLIAGMIVNWATYSLAYEASHLSPWSRRHTRDSRSHVADRLPLFGWWRLRRMSRALGRNFWIRPLLVELGCGVGFILWYWWEVVHGGLLHPHVAPGILAANVELMRTLHAGCAAHFVLFTFMLAASLIDADEWNIPDEVTVPGTLLGLAMMTVWPAAALPSFFDRRIMAVPELLHAASPLPWPAALEAGAMAALLVGWGAIWFWCLGLLVGGRMPRLRYGGKRYRLATAIFLRRIVRDRWFPFVLAIGAASSLAIWGVWNFVPARWPALVSSLLGLVGGAAIVWSVRLLGSWAFQKEAMGFGDVTLMAMIGAYVGWQPVLLVFFLAPVAALVIYVPALLVRRHEMLPYGPYLCVSTFVVLFFWGAIWHWAEPRFFAAWLIPAVLVGGFLIVGVVMSILRRIRGEAKP